MVIQTNELNSDTSTSEVEYLSPDDRRVQVFAKQHLKGQLFMGIFQEKRYVDSIGNYRDVVSIENDETELIKNILAVKEKIERCYSNERWIGITTPDMIGAPASYSLWVELPENTTFGKYWFRLKRIKFSTKEICLRLEVLRSINNETPVKTNKKKTQASDNGDNFSDDIFADIKKDAKEKATYIMQNITTPSNIKDSIVFLCMLVATLTMSLFQLLRYSSEYLLRFIREFSIFLKSIAPLLQILANLIEGIFRNLCMLIAFLFKGSNNKPPPYNPHPSVSYAYQNVRALPAPTRKRGVIIEEIE